jgi:hypothetical protein
MYIDATRDVGHPVRLRDAALPQTALTAFRAPA